MAAPLFFRKAFIDHPASVNETYFEHFRVASHYSRELAGASLKALVHAVVPGLCCTSASEKIKELHGEVTTGTRAELADAREAGLGDIAGGGQGAATGPATGPATESTTLSAG